MSDDRATTSGAPRRAGRGPARRGSPPPGTTRPDTPGGELERRVGRLEFAEGALARLRVRVPSEGAEPGRETLTDIDVLSVDVDMRLRVTRSSAECKSSRGQNGEPGTIIWLAGFRELLGLTRVAFVRPTVSSRGRTLARQLRIAVLDEPTLAARERAVAWVPERFAHIDGVACVSAEARTDTQLKGLPEIAPGLVTFLRHEALLADSHQLIAGVRSLGEAVSRQGVLPEPCGAVLAGHALVALVLAAVEDAARLDNMSEREVRARLERALTTGHPDDTHLMPLLERADALVAHVVGRIHRAYTDAGAKRQPLDVPSLRDLIATPPAYLDDYLDLTSRIRANTAVARDLLQTAELAAFEANLGGSAWTSEAFSHLFTPEHAGLLVAAIRCLEQVAGAVVAGALVGLTDPALARLGTSVPDRRGAPHRGVTVGNGASVPFPASAHERAAEGHEKRRGGPEDDSGQPTLL